MLELNEENFEREIKEKTVVIDFWAEWCPPCKMMGPIFYELSSDSEFKDLGFCKLNVDENPNLAMRFGIMSIPSLVILKNGKEIGRIIGLKTKEKLKEEIKKFLESEK